MFELLHWSFIPSPPCITALNPSNMTMPATASLCCSDIKGAVSVFWYRWITFFFCKLLSKSSHSVFHTLILRFLSLIMCLSATAQQTWISTCACSPERRTLPAALRPVTPPGPKPPGLWAAWHTRATDASFGWLRLVRRQCLNDTWLTF